MSDQVATNQETRGSNCDDEATDEQKVKEEGDGDNGETEETGLDEE
jgi:hypothetical protein